MQPDRKLSIAPMMDRTDRHFRYFLRLISKHTLLYTEMITARAMVHGDRHHLLDYSDREHPLALQIGGSDPAELSSCAFIAEDYGYDEVNLNVGCPSDRVQSGKFGACLMAEPELVAECINKMQQNISIPVTIKTRLGIDDLDSYEQLAAFIQQTSTAGCTTFIIHARKAWLNGLSPKENREVPPLEYEKVYQLKQDFPHLEIIINGGFTTLEQIHEQYSHVDGVMIGRAAYQNPYLLTEVDHLIYKDACCQKTRGVIMEDFIIYVEEQLGKGVPLNAMTRHILGLYQGQRGTRAFRRHLSEHAHKPDAGIEVLQKASEFCE
jgi:tRNA-dihydrouridine synthase A